LNWRALTFAAAVCLWAGPALALDQASWDLELDAYYSDLDFTVPFSSGAAEAPLEQGEIKTYRDMAVKALVPRFMVLEASVNPLPLAGVLIRRTSEGFYYQAQATPSLNLIDAVTAGFEEPYALSLFLGNVVDFAPGETTLRRRKRGYTGYLVSVGNYNILNSVLIPDNWLEAEWKIKGDQETEDRKMSWSFRAGRKFHDNRDIAGTYYVGIRRDRVDFKPLPWSFLLSTAIDYRVDFNSENLRPISHYILVEKNFPTPKHHWTFSIGVGYLWIGEEKYTGALAALRPPSQSQILIRPNIKF
jgi:hypothetical protein